LRFEDRPAIVRKGVRQIANKIFLGIKRDFLICLSTIPRTIRGVRGFQTMQHFGNRRQHP
ncbi:MAG TPA: hypothetical protein VMJ12_18880, partial [Candidatus Acidoferrales bacterium]|nr:hypothetical protein [Candidatus Acidoferrales bacterium]